MKQLSKHFFRKFVPGLALAFIMSLACPGGVNAFTINVVDDDGNPITGGFRWMVEEDTTVPVVPGSRVNDSISLTIHKSYSPVAQTGEEQTASSVDVNLPEGRYMVSILPRSTTESANYTLSGSNFSVGPPPMPTETTVTVHSQPVPTAQISVYVFHDYKPINGEPDIPEEEGLAGFTIMLSDIFGQQMMDVYGNPLGTTYMQMGDEWMVDQMGTGIILTDANGEAMVRNIAAGKYGMRIIPPLGTTWVQTNTIEGTQVIDAWVRAGEPALMLEGWGPGFYHCFFGFTQPADRLAELPNPTGETGTITGQFINNHLSKPPQILGFPGAPVEEAWVALNLVSTRECFYVAPCAADGSFSIPGVPPGVYQIGFFDTPLDWIFDFKAVIVPAGGGLVELGSIPGTWHGSVVLKDRFSMMATGTDSLILGNPGCPARRSICDSVMDPCIRRPLPIWLGSILS